MADIFGRIDQAFGGGLSADSMFMTWSALDAQGAGLLIQNVSLQYTQPVRKIYELGPGRGGSQLTYYVVGRPDGSLQIARIVGFAAISIQFYEKYGSPCQENPDITITGKTGCNGVANQGDMQWTLSGVLLNGVGMSASAQEMLIQESVAAQFIELKIEELQE